MRFKEMLYYMIYMISQTNILGFCFLLLFMVLRRAINIQRIIGIIQLCEM